MQAWTRVAHDVQRSLYGAYLVINWTPIEMLEFYVTKSHKILARYTVYLSRNKLLTICLSILTGSLLIAAILTYPSVAF